ncbi:TonB-dependent receptor domain protein [Fusobacterium necrophorum subsp. funduliforme]|uniref:TonB-dependent receptor n=1 Tax=Fusobacterium necrophorum TaxID=859 RepID=UPI000788C36D|nr:TonB-dependent receptor [Fusobacterium necrophorum]KYM51062.1 hemin receptor [Fusobacterium necrophorum subsp. funduliforme]MDK4480983.1 TonB-dependent receptor [Fusobacterium necrophorum]MDK4492515.1 TonB-dependent receptor [Fusobacterium necrophorum]
MRKEMLLTLLCFVSLHAMAATQEVELNPTKIRGGATYNGSVLSNEKKNVIIITKADIEKKNYRDLESIFKDSPVTSVVYTEAGPLVTLRGSGQKTAMRVKVLLDGVSINTVDDSMGVIPFNAIPVTSIEKIEIIPGGGITLHGSGTSSGVINIVTGKSSKKDYGELGFTVSSFNTYNTTFNKGISFGDKLYWNIGVEAEKGKAYREKEDSKKINLLSGINYKINEKHQIKLHGSKYWSDFNGTNELDLISLQKNRRGAGKSDANVKSNRYSLSFDYEYKPTEDLTVTSGYNQQKFRRNFTQNNKPYLTFLPSEWVEDMFGIPDGMNADLVIKNVNNRLTGRIEEKIKNGKVKVDWKHSNNRGKLTFGYDYSSYELKRRMNVQVDPFNPIDNNYFFLRKKEERIINEEILEQHPDQLMHFFDNNLAAILIFDPDSMDSYGLDSVKLKKKIDELYYHLTTSEKDKKKYENGEENPWDYWETIKPNMWKMIYRLTEEKIQEYAKDGKNILKREDENDWDSEPSIPVPIEGKKFKEFLRMIIPSMYDPDFSMTPITQSMVDVKKTTNSFYLFDSYKLTDRLEINGGLRYEKAKYSGNRYTKTEQFIKGNAENKSTNAMIAMYTELSEAESAKKNIGDSHHWNGNDTSKEKIKELKEKGYTTILMTDLTRKERREEENLGGEIGLNYRFNDTDTVYLKYERGFNTPLPTQLTNKTFDPKTKIKAYWESNVKTEKIDNVELGIRGMLHPKVTYSLTGFISDTQNEILSIVKNGSSHMLREWRFINIDKTRRMGLEFQSQQNFEKLTLKESLTYVDPKILSNDYEKQVHKIGVDRAEEMYQNNQKVRDWTIENITFHEKGFKIPTGSSEVEIAKMKAESNRLGKEAVKIIQKLRETGVKVDYSARDAKLNEIIPGMSSAEQSKIRMEASKLAQEAENRAVAEPRRALEELFANSAYPDIFKEKLRSFDRYTLIREGTMKEIIYEQFEKEIKSSHTKGTLEKGSRIPLSPKWKGTLSADYQFTDKLRLGMNTTYIGSYDSAEPGKGYEIVMTKVPHHMVADFYGSYDIQEDFSIKFGINNVFNHQYYLRQDSRTATPAPGRTYSAGFHYRF